MHFKSKSKQATIAGATGTALTALWRAYSAVTTAQQVPEDLKEISHMLADPGFWPWLFMAGFVLLLGWSLWPRKEEPVADAGASQTTHGAGSPIIGTARDVYIGKEPPTESKPVVPQQTRAEARQPFDYGPNMDLAEVVARLHKKCPRLEGAALDEKIDLAITDAAHHGLIRVWGRMGPKKARSVVWDDAWESGEFSHVKGLVFYRSPDNPNSPFRWVDLGFNKPEVENWLQGNDGRSEIGGY